MDHPLTGVIIVEGLPNGSNTASQYRILNEYIGPDVLEEFLAGDETIGVLEQIHQYLIDFWL